jgi:hypothetical protein
MAKQPLKNRENTAQMRTVLRASERVSSWPEWKRSTTLYRSSETSVPRNVRRAEVGVQEANRNV